MLAVDVAGAGDAAAAGTSSEFSSLIETSSTRLWIVNYTNYCKPPYDIATPSGKLDVNIGYTLNNKQLISIFCAAIE